MWMQLINKRKMLKILVNLPPYQLIFFPLRLCLELEKYLGEEKNDKENDFLMFGSMVENIKENQI